MPRRRAALTLIELLVVVGIIGLLIAIFLPSLTNSRRAASKAVQLANLRQTAAVFQMYTDVNRGELPFAPPGSRFRVNPPDEPNGAWIQPGFWDLSLYWPSLLHEIAPWRSHFDLWVVPAADRADPNPWESSPGGRGTGIPSYSYCRAHFARPALWSEAPVPDPAALLAPVRIQEVRRPAEKVLLFDAEAPLRRLVADSSDSLDSRAMVFVDGHAEFRRLSRANPPVQPQTADAPPASPLHDTAQGAYGADY